MRPERITTRSPLAESSPADQRTEGSHQRMVSQRFVAWAGNGWPTGHTEIRDGGIYTPGVIWPIVDTKTTSVNGYPTPEQYFAIAYTAKAAKEICAALNALANDQAQ